MAQVLQVQLADPASRLRKCPVISSAVELEWATAPSIPVREARRKIRRLHGELEELSQTVRQLKQEKDENESLLHTAGASAVEIQRMFRGVLGRQAARMRRRQVASVRTILRVARGYASRKKVAKLRAALLVRDEATRDAMLQELSVLDRTREEALAEMQAAKERYTHRRNVKYSSSAAGESANAPASAVTSALSPAAGARVQAGLREHAGSQQQSGSEAGPGKGSVGLQSLLAQRAQAGPPWWQAYEKERRRDTDEVLAIDVSPPKEATRRAALTSEEIDACARPIVCSSYEDFREERALLCSLAYPEVHELCAERGVAFSPIEPFLQMEFPLYGRRRPPWQWALTDPESEPPPAFRDELAWSRTTLASLLAVAPKSNGCFLWVGAKYGWVPKGQLMAQVKKQFGWVNEFYHETGFDSASITEIVFNRFVVEKVDHASCVRMCTWMCACV